MLKPPFKNSFKNYPSSNTKPFYIEKLKYFYCVVLSMPHNPTIIICKDAPIGAAVISRIKNTKQKIKSCVDCKGYRSNKNQNAKYNERGFGC
jgi:hypothetical protein